MSELLAYKTRLKHELQDNSGMLSDIRNYVRKTGDSATWNKVYLLLTKALTEMKHADARRNRTYEKWTQKVLVDVKTIHDSLPKQPKKQTPKKTRTKA